MVVACGPAGAVPTEKIANMAAGTSYCGVHAEVRRSCIMTSDWNWCPSASTSTTTNEMVAVWGNQVKEKGESVSRFSRNFLDQVLQVIIQDG